MKSKQLANVLIKMLGFFICLYAIPSFVSGIVFGLEAKNVSSTDITVMRIFSSAVGSGIEAVFGVIVIAASRKIAGWMFKSDDE